MTTALLNRTELQPLFDANWLLLDTRDAITKDFQFKSFKQAWAWMSEIALCAEQLDHHPEWSNTYNNVEIILTTHDAGEITDLDIKLANKIDTIEKKYK